MIFKFFIIGEGWRTVANHCEQLGMANSRSPPFMSDRDRSPWLAVIRHPSPMMKNLKIITDFYLKIKFFCMKNLCVQLFRESVLSF
jgi:hypothetical protein